MLSALKVSNRENFTSRVYAQLREALMAGRFWPGQRLRIGELALAMGVSQTPVREAIMQLVREGGLEIRSSQAITVANLSLSRYKELREVRLLLEGLPPTSRGSTNSIRSLSHRRRAAISRRRRSPISTFTF
jgi:DNA-binding GntR family transcriptional regulator